MCYYGFVTHNVYIFLVDGMAIYYLPPGDSNNGYIMRLKKLCFQWLVKYKCACIYTTHTGTPRNDSWDYTCIKTRI